MIINLLYKKVYEDYIEFDTEQTENTKSAERQKTSFPKESVENAGLYKPVLNKKMITYEQYVKYNFAAPLTRSCLLKRLSPLEL